MKAQKVKSLIFTFFLVKNFHRMTTEKFRTFSKAKQKEETKLSLVHTIVLNKIFCFGFSFPKSTHINPEIYFEHMCCCHTSSVTYLSGECCIEIFTNNIFFGALFCETKRVKFFLKYEFQINWGIFSLLLNPRTEKCCFWLFVWNFKFREKKERERKCIYRFVWKEIFLLGISRRFSGIYAIKMLKTFPWQSINWMFKKFSFSTRDLLGIFLETSLFKI